MKLQKTVNAGGQRVGRRDMAHMRDVDVLTLGCLLFCLIALVIAC